MNNNLNDLDEKIRQFKEKGQTGKKIETDKDAEANNMRLGIRAGTELLVTIGAGVLIGYFLDQWLGTKPLFLIIFMLAGVGAGFMNIYRITQNMGSQVGFAPLHKEKKQGTNTAENDEK